MSQTIKISGLVEFEITLPDGLILPLSAQFGQAAEPSPTPAATPPSNGAFPDTRNGYLADRVAEFIRDAGPAGCIRTDISRNFASTIKNAPQRDAILAMLPDLFYRQSIDPNPSTGKLTGAERWTYFYSEETE